jgi:DNA-binding NarL/FixJ family response regulator
VQTLQIQAATKAVTRAETDALSAREIEVLQALSKGHTYKQIASDLGISLGTVRTYIQRIYEKLHVHSHAEAVMKFARK